MYSVCRRDSGQAVGAIHQGHIAFSTNRDQSIFKKLNSPYAPLGNFAGKIQLAYAYGLIDKATFDDLEIIRQLRNEAAHCMFDFSLENAGIVSFVNKLTALARSRHSEIRTGAGGIEAAISSSVKGAAKQRFLANGFALHLILMYRVVQHADRLLEKEKRKHLP